MGRHRPSGSTDHRCRKMGLNWYRISWTVDYYYVGHRCRFPRGFDRDTDSKGAKRFCKKWGLIWED
jgi:hypothetical protein